MALGLLLQVSWIFLLFDGSAGLPAIKGYGYPYTSDSRNIGDDGEDEALTSPTFDESNWQNNLYTSYNKLPVAQPYTVLSRLNLPNTPSGPEVQKLINGALRDWRLGSFDKPLLFPLLSAPAKPQPGSVQPQSTSLSAASTNSMPASPSTGGSTHSAGPTSSTSQAASYESWQPEPVSSGYGVVDFNAEDDIPHLVYEDVFQYPSENTESSQSYDAVSNTAGGYGEAMSTLEEPSLPSYPTNTGAQPVYLPEMGNFPGGVNLNFDQTDSKPHDEKISWHPQNVEVSQKVSEPILPPSPPPSYIIQSINGYERGRHLFSNSRYLPDFPPPMPVRAKTVKGPAPSQPAAPKGVKNPQKTNW